MVQSIGPWFACPRIDWTLICLSFDRLDLVLLVLQSIGPWFACPLIDRTLICFCFNRLDLDLLVIQSIGPWFACPSIDWTLFSLYFNRVDLDLLVPQSIGHWFEFLVLQSIEPQFECLSSNRWDLDLLVLYKDWLVIDLSACPPIDWTLIWVLGPPSMGPWFACPLIDWSLIWVLILQSIEPWFVCLPPSPHRWDLDFFVLQSIGRWFKCLSSDRLDLDLSACFPIDWTLICSPFIKIESLSSNRLDLDLSACPTPPPTPIDWALIFLCSNELDLELRVLQSIGPWFACPL